MKLILKWIGNIITGILLVALALTIISNVQSKMNPSKIPSILGYMPMSILSGSMTPMLQVGDMIISKGTATDNIKVGDVITFRVDQNMLVTHRVKEIVEKDGGISFRTQGDANNVEDEKLVGTSQIVGSMLFNIPYGGYIVKYLKSPIGFVLLVIFPLLLLLIGEVSNISKNVEPVVKKKEERVTID